VPYIWLSGGEVAELEEAHALADRLVSAGDAHAELVEDHISPGFSHARAHRQQGRMRMFSLATM